MLHYTSTPVQEIFDAAFDKAGVRVLIKREDLNHPFVSGNKWWKLKYNLEAASHSQHTTLLTFGGAYSNHIYATAAAASEMGFKSIGMIRGEETLPLNDTLTFARQMGMQIHYISREAYSKKTDPEFIRQLHDQLGEFYLIPEGGTNALAVQGVSEFARNLVQSVSFAVVCLPVGTGGTLAGFISGLHSDKKIMGVSVLKGGDFLNKEIEKWLPQNQRNWRLITDYHFGGYAKHSLPLDTFINSFKTNHHIVLEPIYTGKMFYAVFDLIHSGFFARGTTLLAIHTGGLQALKNNS